MEKEKYLVYMVYNLMDGHDFEPIGVYPSMEKAILELSAYAEEEENFLFEDDTLQEARDKEYMFLIDELGDRSYNIEKVKVYE